MSIAVTINSPQTSRNHMTWRRIEKTSPNLFKCKEISED
jgi:hypothetical protein